MLFRSLAWKPRPRTIPGTALVGRSMIALVERLEARALLHGGAAPPRR